MPVISIIIPVYNAGKYLCTCLDSITTQTYKDWELILVDDGSKDYSGPICDEYAAKDPRIKVIHKDNGGVSSARNEGLKVAKGEWIYFCDSDDQLTSNESLKYLIGLSDHADLVVAGNNCYEEDGSLFPKVKGVVDFNGTMNPHDYAFQFFIDNKCIGYQGFLWNKFFKQSVIKANNLQFYPEIKFAEDMLFVTQYTCCKEISSIRINNTLKIYDYFERDGGAMNSLKHSYNPKFFTDFLAFEIIEKTISDRFKDPELIHNARLRLYLSGYTNKNLMTEFNSIDQTKVEYINKSLARFPELVSEAETKIGLDKMKSEALKHDIDSRVSITNHFLHSKECHFKYLKKKWKVAYILSLIGGEAGLRLIKNRMNYNSSEY